MVVGVLIAVAIVVVVIAVLAALLTGFVLGMETGRAAARAEAVPVERDEEGTDPVDRLLLIAIGQKVAELRKRERRDLAVEVVNALGEAMKKGRR